MTDVVEFDNLKTIAPLIISLKSLIRLFLMKR